MISTSTMMYKWDLHLSWTLSNISERSQQVSKKYMNDHQLNCSDLYPVSIWNAHHLRTKCMFQASTDSALWSISHQTWDITHSKLFLCGIHTKTGASIDVLIRFQPKNYKLQTNCIELCLYFTFDISSKILRRCQKHFLWLDYTDWKGELVGSVLNHYRARWEAWNCPFVT